MTLTKPEKEVSSMAETNHIKTEKVTVEVSDYVFKYLNEIRENQGLASIDDALIRVLVSHHP